MTQWEYKVVDVEEYDIREPLSNAGKDGWELVSTNAGIHLRLIFKRPLVLATEDNAIAQAFRDAEADVPGTSDDD